MKYGYQVKELFLPAVLAVLVAASCELDGGQPRPAATTPVYRGYMEFEERVLAPLESGLCAVADGEDYRNAPSAQSRDRIEDLCFPGYKLYVFRDTLFLAALGEDRDPWRFCIVSDGKPLSEPGAVREMVSSDRYPSRLKVTVRSGGDWTVEFEPSSGSGSVFLQAVQEPVSVPEPAHELVRQFRLGGLAADWSYYEHSYPGTALNTAFTVSSGSYSVCQGVRFDGGADYRMEREGRDEPFRVDYGTADSPFFTITWRGVSEEWKKTGER